MNTSVRKARDPDSNPFPGNKFYSEKSSKIFQERVVDKYFTQPTHWKCWIVNTSSLFVFLFLLSHDELTFPKFSSNFLSLRVNTRGSVWNHCPVSLSLFSSQNAIDVTLGVTDHWIGAGAITLWPKPMTETTSQTERISNSFYCCHTTQDIGHISTLQWCLFVLKYNLLNVK